MRIQRTTTIELQYDVDIIDVKLNGKKIAFTCSNETKIITISANTGRITYREVHYFSTIGVHSVGICFERNDRRFCKFQIILLRESQC